MGNSNMTEPDGMDEGSGDEPMQIAIGESRSNVEICMDKIVMPCDSEDFLMVSMICRIY